MKYALFLTAALCAVVDFAAADNLRSSIRDRLDDAFELDDFGMSEAESMVLDLDEEVSLGAKILEPKLYYKKPSRCKLVGYRGEDTTCEDDEEAMYMMADEDEDLWMVLCGRKCKVKSKIAVDTDGCTDYDAIPVSMSGIDHELFRKEGKECVPYTDRKPYIKRKYRRAMAECGKKDEIDDDKVKAAPKKWVENNFKDSVFAGLVEFGLEIALSKFKIAGPLFKLVDKVADKLAKPLKALGEKVLGGIRNLGSKLKPALKKVGSKLKSVAKTVGSKVKEGTKKVGRFFKKLFG